MANIKETNAWEAGIYQLETTDPVVGGVDGISNKQAKQLANRTTYLKQKVESLQTSLQESQNAINGKLDANATAANSAKLGGLDSSRFVQVGSNASLNTLYLTQNAEGDNLKIGDDAWIGDANIANGIGLKGNTDANKGFIKFGAGAIFGYDGSRLTYGSNEVWHAGNVRFSVDKTPNAAVIRDANGDFSARRISVENLHAYSRIDDELINANTPLMYRGGDGFVRPASIAKIKEILGVTDKNGDFASQKNENGYTKLPNGLMLQWGRVYDVPADERKGVIFPVAFPNLCLNVSITYNANDTRTEAGGVAYAARVSKTGFQAEYQALTSAWSNYPTVHMFWIAIGY